MTNNDLKELTDFLDNYGVYYKVVKNRVEADKVDLAFRSIIYLPDSIGNLKCEKLYLYNNRLTSLPNSFGNLKCKYLNFSFNQLTSESRHLLEKMKSNGVRVIY